MARNSGGTYSLPTGQPVVSGTTISSSVHNALASDVAAEITDSLSRSGKGGMSAALRGINGTSAAPSFAFTNDTGVGMYRKSSGVGALAAGAADAAEWSSAGFTLGVPLAAPSATVGGVAVVPSTLVYLSADRTTTSSTMANVTDLSFAVVANGVYAVELSAFVGIAAAQNVSFDFTGPAAPTSVRITSRYHSQTLGGTASANDSAFSSPFLAMVEVGGAARVDLCTVYMVIVNGANAGTVQLRFKNSDNATTATVYKGSILRWQRVA